MIIQSVWWRRITPNDLFNIEKPLPPGPKGQLHLDVPNVSGLHDFFEIQHDVDSSNWQTIEVDLGVFRDPSISRKLTFRPRPKNNRYDIQRQNINSESSERHPAWTSAYGWPPIHGQINSTKSATEFLNVDPLIILILKSDNGSYYADFISGFIDSSQDLGNLNEIFFGKTTGSLVGISLQSSADLISLMEVDSLFGTSAKPKKSGSVSPPIPKIKSKSSKLKKSQGFGLAPQLRRAVEKHAVSLAIEHFSEAGWQNIQDVGDFASYDLTMVRDGMVHIVEVKGTTGSGENIILTKNEVAVHKEFFPHNALVVVSQIKITSNDPPILEGGVLNVIQPWSLVEDWLVAMSFTYEVENHARVSD
jgi:hypothetical protein